MPNVKDKDRRRNLNEIGALKFCKLIDMSSYFGHKTRINTSCYYDYGYTIMTITDSLCRQTS